MILSTITLMQGGYTENNENVWIGGPIVYLRSVEELYPAPRPSSWKRRSPRSSSLDLLGRQGAGRRDRLGGPTGATAAGRVTGLRIQR